MLVFMDSVEDRLPCNTCPVTLGKRNEPVASNAVWCKHCPFVGERKVDDHADDGFSDAEHRTAPEGLTMSDRVQLERRIMQAEKIVAASLPRNEFVLYVESTQENVAKFYTHYFAPVNVRSIVAIVLAFIGLVLACVAIILIILQH